MKTVFVLIALILSIVSPNNNDTYKFRVNLEVGDKILGISTGDMDVSITKRGKKENAKVRIEKKSISTVKKYSSGIYSISETIKLKKFLVDGSDVTDKQRSNNDGSYTMEVNDRWILKDDLKANDKETEEMIYYKHLSSDADSKIIFNLFPMKIGDTLRNGIGKSLPIGTMNVTLSYTSFPDNIKGGVILKRFEERDGVNCGVFELDFIEKYNDKGAFNTIECDLDVTSVLKGQAWISLEHGFIIEMDEYLEQHIIGTINGSRLLCDLKMISRRKNKLVNR